MRRTHKDTSPMIDTSETVTLPDPEQTAWECLMAGADEITLAEAQEVFDTMLRSCGVEGGEQP